jgi:hypothetical protein
MWGRADAHIPSTSPSELLHVHLSEVNPSRAGKKPANPLRILSVLLHQREPRHAAKRHSLKDPSPPIFPRPYRPRLYTKRARHRTSHLSGPRLSPLLTAVVLPFHLIFVSCLLTLCLPPHMREIESEVSAPTTSDLDLWRNRSLD